jgi:hypothetical protein
MSPRQQVADACDVEILLEFILLGGGRDGNPESDIAHPPQQVRNCRERSHKRQVLGLETIATPLLQFLTVVSLFAGGEEDGNELVSPLANLTSSLFEAHIVAELDHRFVPGERVKIHGIQKRSVQVEDSGFRQFKVLQFGASDARIPRFSSGSGHSRQRNVRHQRFHLDGRSWGLRRISFSAALLLRFRNLHFECAFFVQLMLAARRKRRWKRFRFNLFTRK